MTDREEGDGKAAPNKARRAFLVGTAVGAAGAATGGALIEPAEARTRVEKPAKDAHASTDMHRHDQGQGAFFNDDDYATIVAIAERIMPGAPGKPGATDAGVANYIDLALAGFYMDQQFFYRQGLAALDAYCMATFKDSFVYLKPDQQDQALTALEENKAPQFTWPTARAFFETLRTHTAEGMFSDPVYGGNRDFAGWRLIGFPGAQPTFTAEDMASPKAFTRAPIMGLQQVAKTSKRRI